MIIAATAGRISAEYNRDGFEREGWYGFELATFDLVYLMYS